MSTLLCQYCRTPVEMYHPAQSSLCNVCSLQEKDFKSYVSPATITKLEVKTNNVESLESYKRQEGFGKGTGGVKDDASKSRWDLLPWKAVNGLVKVLTFGAKKYSPNGWRSVPNAQGRYTAALMRHLYAMNAGESIDPESGLRHVDHLLCNAAFLAE